MSDPVTPPPTIIVRPHPVAAAPGNPPPAPAPDKIPNFEKMSFAEQRHAQEQLRAAAKQKG
jgi:hypothetical protein